MIDRILTVGGYTLLSRLTGFLRDVVMAAVLGAGPVADAFLVAFRLPNHFRAIFAEGAFSAAFVPAYARIRVEGGAEKARLFADRIFTLLLIVQLVLLAFAIGFTPAVIRVLAPGFGNDPDRFALAVALTRVTFPYLLAMTLVSLYGGMLNALDRFAAAAAAPILLNLSMMATLALAPFFPSAGHAAAWGVLIAGVLEVALLAGSTARLGELPRLARIAWDADVKRFFAALGPATIGSGGVQLAVFADTIIASFLPAGAISALYYADRLNQLPIGVIGIAVGTVLLPEMSRRIAAGDEDGARGAQSRAIEFTLLLSLPCLVAFLMIPDLIMRALFARGAFTAADAAAAGATLAAYAFGLVPIVLMRSMVAMFFARGDTATPVKAALIAVPVNIAFKILLMGPLAQVGLALATIIGAWINFALVLWFGARAGYLRRDPDLMRAIGKLIAAGAALALVLWLGRVPALDLFAASGRWRDLFGLLLLAAVGGAVYAGVALALFGRQWLTQLRRRRAAAGAAKPLPDPQVPLGNPPRLRDFCAIDAPHVNRLALAAFEQFKAHYSDWSAMAASIGRMATLAEAGEIILAEQADKIIGAVTYVAPGRPKPSCFEAGWPIIRMLVVDPDCRGLGAGRALTEACLERARRDGSPVIALHTSPFMTVALSMYARMGFERLRQGPFIFGAPSAVYLKRLSPRQTNRPSP